MTELDRVKGILIPIGGNEDKGHEDYEDTDIDFIEEGILFHVVNQSGGTNAKFIIIPTASRIPDAVGKSYEGAFDKLGCKNHETLNITTREQAEDPLNLEKINSANCVMFSGGNQSRITEIIGGTSMHQLLTEKFVNEKFVIAGTSAGAMAMSEEMIAGGSNTESLIKGASQLKKGMSFISKLIIDTHFVRRGRYGRLAEALANFPQLIGIGLAENTGLIIKNCNEFDVIGSGMVIVFDPSQLTHNNHKILKEGTPLSMSNLITHLLSNGDRFTLDNRSIEVLPIEASFV
jgi:cyanophycinase